MESCTWHLAFCQARFRATVRTQPSFFLLPKLQGVECELEGAEELPLPNEPLFPSLTRSGHGYSASSCVHPD
jgi:hypothetical protein